MARIFKYSLEIADEQLVSMPKGAKLLDIQVQNNQAVLWAYVDPDVASELVKFAVVGTGHDVLPTDSGSYFYIATIQSGPFVWHFFRIDENG